jgi:ERF superfamily.
MHFDSLSTAEQLHFLTALKALKDSLKVVAYNKSAKLWKYADLNTIRDSIAEPLEAHGFFIQDFVKENTVITRLYLLATTGEYNPVGYLESQFCLASDIDPMDAGKAITYGRRYNLTVLLAIRTGEEEDTDGVDISRGRSSRGRHRRDRVPPETEIY